MRRKDGQGSFMKILSMPFHSTPTVDRPNYLFDRPLVGKEVADEESFSLTFHTIKTSSSFIVSYRRRLGGGGEVNDSSSVFLSCWIGKIFTNASNPTCEEYLRTNLPRSLSAAALFSSSSMQRLMTRKLFCRWRS